MEQIAYVNGSFVPLAEAKVSILDRGFLFADGIYEVAAVLDGKLIDNASHLARLERSVGEIELALPETTDRIQEIQKELIDAQQSRQRHGLSGGDARRRYRARFRVSQGRQADAGHVHLGQGHHQRAVGENRHRRHHGARHPLDPARHQERRAAGAGTGKTGRGRSRRRRGLDDRGRHGDRGRLVIGLHPDPGRCARDAAERQRDPARLHPQGGGRRSPKSASFASRSGRLRSKRRWRRRKPSSPAPACSCRRWCRSTARRSPTASPVR